MLMDRSCAIAHSEELVCGSVSSLLSFWLVLKEAATERPGSRIWGLGSEQEAPLVSCLSHSSVQRGCVTVLCGRVPLQGLTTEINFVPVLETRG